MKVPLLLVASICSLSVALAACGDAEEEVAPVPTATPDAATPTPAMPSPGPDVTADGPLGSPTVISPPATPSANTHIPADWLTFTNPDGLYTVQYPPNWYAEGGTFSTFKLGTVLRFPEEAIKVDISSAPESQLGGCTSEPGASDMLVDMQPATIVSKDYSGSVVTRSHNIRWSYHDYCYAITALFSQIEPDDGLFMRFVSSFRLGK